MLLWAPSQGELTGDRYERFATLAQNRLVAFGFLVLLPSLVMIELPRE